MVEISGIPYGLTSEMLNYETGGNPYRGMIYAMDGRQHPSAPYLWEFWDEFGIQESEMLGYWSEACPVRTGRDDILATAYRKPDRSLIALASWADASTKVDLQIDWETLGLDASKSHFRVPTIEHFQESQDFDVDGSIPVEAGKGWLTVVEE